MKSQSHWRDPPWEIVKSLRCNTALFFNVNSQLLLIKKVKWPYRVPQEANAFCMCVFTPKEIKLGMWSNNSSYYLDGEMALRKPCPWFYLMDYIFSISGLCSSIIDQESDELQMVQVFYAPRQNATVCLLLHMQAVKFHK